MGLSTWLWALSTFLFHLQHQGYHDYLYFTNEKTDLEIMKTSQDYKTGNC